MTDSEILRIARLCTDVVKEHMRWIEDHDRPLVGSPIAQDDLLFTVMSMTELVVSPIKGAWDCLYVVCSSLFDLEEVRGIGHAALVRSAITAATTSLWILDDDELARRARALIIARAQCVAERDFIQGVAPDWHGSNTMIGALTEHVRQRVDRVTADGERIGVDAETIAKKPKDSKIVRAGGERIPATVLGGHQPGPYIVSEWRLLSAGAHGFHWPAKYANEPRRGEHGHYVVLDATIPAERFLGSVRAAMVAARVATDRFAAFAGTAPAEELRKPWELQ